MGFLGRTVIAFSVAVLLTLSLMGWQGPASGGQLQITWTDNSSNALTVD